MGADVSAMGCCGANAPHPKKRYDAPDMPGCGTGCHAMVPVANKDRGRMEMITVDDLHQDRIDAWMTKEGYFQSSATCSGKTAAACGVHQDTMAPTEYYAETPDGLHIRPGPDQWCWLEEEEEVVAFGGRLAPRPRYCDQVMPEFEDDEPRTKADDILEVKSAKAKHQKEKRSKRPLSREPPADLPQEAAKPTVGWFFVPEGAEDQTDVPSSREAVSDFGGVSSND